MDQEFCFVPPQTHDYSDSEPEIFKLFFQSDCIPKWKALGFKKQTCNTWI